MTTQRTPEGFVATWRGNTSTERQVYQQHFLDLCALVGHPTPVQLDPENKFFTFEAGAAKLSGGQGWADVWFKGHFAIEYKGPDKSLARAYEQLLQYRESLETGLPDKERQKRTLTNLYNARRDTAGRMDWPMRRSWRGCWR